MWSQIGENLGLKKPKIVVLPFSDRPEILQNLGRDFFFFFKYSNFNFYCKSVTKLAIFSTGSFSLVIRIVLNSSVFGFTARKVLWQSGCHHLLCIFCLGALTLTRGTCIRVFKKKKKDFRPTDPPNLKILSPEGQRNIFFYLALLIDVKPYNRASYNVHFV